MDVDIDKPITNAFNEIIAQDFEKARKKYLSNSENSRKEKLLILLYKKRFSIPLMILILILICALILGIIFILNTPDDDDITTITPTTLIEETLPVLAINTTEQPFVYKEISRYEWQGESLFYGKYIIHVDTAIKRIILLTTETDSCNSEEDCKEFILNQQEEAYPEYDDISENFLITIEGIVIEGRGFEREGESTCKIGSRTCYNSEAISISFIQKPNDGIRISRYQREALFEFINHHRNEFHENFKIFFHDDLINSELNKNLCEELKCDSDLSEWLYKGLQTNKK